MEYAVSQRLPIQSGYHVRCRRENGFQLICLENAVFLVNALPYISRVQWEIKSDVQNTIENGLYKKTSSDSVVIQIA